jgi:hypothetical protein
MRQILPQTLPRAVLALTCLALAGCLAAPETQVTKARPGGASGSEPGFIAPPVPEFLPAALPASPRHGDAEMAASFMDLSFAMESGRTLDRFSRFEGPVTIALTGAVPPTAQADLDHVIARLRGEAGINVRRSAAPGASITVDFTPRATLRRLAPTAACFVVPNVSSLAEYRARRGSSALDWAAVVERQRVAIFAPSDASPQEVRDCLHEELAQALGPLNDLYRLSDSVFNDDNFNSVLTPFDMVILRATYAPELRSGMSRAQVQALIGPIMARVNGAGPGFGGAGPSPTPRAWINAIETAITAGGAQSTRRAAAERALAIAQGQGWQDARLAFSHFALARLYVGSDRDRALAEFAQAAAIYGRQPGGAIHVAHIEMQLAAMAVASGQPERAIALADRALPAIRAAQNQALLATVLLIKAEALDMLGLGAQAQALRVDSSSAARYGFGSAAQVRARQREISALGGQWPPQG